MVGFVIEAETLWGDSSPVEESSDFQPVTVGLRLFFSAPGQIAGLRFYQDPAQDWDHIGLIFDATGVLLSASRFNRSTTVGWVNTWIHPYVRVDIDTAYIVAVWFANGGYWRSSGALSGGAMFRGSITAPQDEDGAPNGIYQYDSSLFPALTYGSTAYGVDVLYYPAA